MKTIVLISKIVLFSLLCIDLFLWAAAHASGHKLPSKTQWSFALSSFILTALLILVNFLAPRLKKN